MRTIQRLVRQLRSYGVQFRRVTVNEYRMLFGDAGAMLILIFALLIYATLYSLAYGPEVLRNVPIGVVDESQTPASRALIRTFDAGPNVYVAYEPSDMEEAEKLFYDREIYGVVYIPEEYERRLLGGDQATVPIYADASYFLVYRQVFQELATSIVRTGALVEFQRLVARGAQIPQAMAMTQPVVFGSHNLFNPYLGYGTFVMPAILMVIIQQTLLIGLGMVGGTWREFGLYRRLCPPGRTRMSTLPVVAGRTLAYGSVYTVTTLYVLCVHYRLFHYPIEGSPATLAALLVPYLLACILLGIAVSTLFRYREQSLLFLLWTSIPFLLLSGISYPREAIPEWLFSLGKLLPSTHGVNGFIRIRSMGASIGEVMPEIRALWMLVLLYGGMACLGLHRLLRRECTCGDVKGDKL